MIPFALVSGPLPKTGAIVAAILVAVAVLAPGRRSRALAMLAALILAPALLLADIWTSPQLHLVHDHPLRAAALAVLGLGVIAGLAMLITQRAWLVAPLVVLTLPFRIPISTGGTTANLLVPLYVVLAAATLAYVVGELRSAGRGGRSLLRARSGAWRPAGAAGWVELLLVGYVVLYAIQAAYSLDFQRALQQVVFFYVPFALAYCLLRRLEWNPRLIRMCLLLAAALAIVFSAVGFAEYATKTIFLNPKLIATNADHTYFAVNSVFFDSNIFGRFLALVMVLLAVSLLYERRPREQISATAVLAVLWAGLVLTLSRSSLGALLAGLAVLAALRWKISRTVLVGLAVVAAGAIAVAATPHTFGIEQGFNGVFSGRGSLISGGVRMFGQRPLWGWGSGSFQTEYLIQNPRSPGGVGDSHTLPVTIAAEQGVIGEVVYLGLVAAALITLLRGARADPTRAALAAAFVGLVVHTLVYDDFLSDPISWALLGVGVALARATRPALDQPAVLPAVGVEAVPA